MEWIKLILTKKEKEDLKTLSASFGINMSKLIRNEIEQKDDIEIREVEEKETTATFKITKQNEDKLIKIGKKHNLSKNQVLRLMIIKMCLEKGSAAAQNENFDLEEGEYRRGVKFNINDLEKIKLRKKCDDLGFGFSEVFRKMFKSFHLKDYNVKATTPRNTEYSVSLSKSEIDHLEKLSRDYGFENRANFIQSFYTYILNHDIKEDLK